MKKALVLILVLILLLSSATACGKKEEEAPPVEEPVAEEPAVIEETPVPKEPEPMEEPAEPEEPAHGPMNPLTGLPTETDYTNLRPYVFMCNNIRVAMPHCGVSQSDMIMEMMDEAGITRFMVWFMDPTNVEKIGSIRSIRQYNVETAFGYDAFLGHCGGSDEAQASAKSYGVLDVDQFILGDAAYYRDRSRQTYGIEHSMFAVGSKIVNGALNIRGYSAEHPEGYDGTYGMVFSEKAVDQCADSAESVHVQYAGGKETNFTYDAENQAYLMYQYGAEYSDDGKGGIYFQNVINMYADTRLQSDGKHLTIELNKGDGTFFTQGKAVAIKWYKDGLKDCFHFTLEDGTPLEFTPGRTFFCVNQTGGHNYQGICTWQ